MKILCRNCGKPIASTDLDLSRGLANCTKCNEVFDCRDQLDAASGSRVPVGLPKHLEIREEYSGITIERRWWGPHAIFLTIFCVVWDGFLVFWYKTAFGGEGNLFAKLFPLGHVAAGVWLTYYTIALYVNRTVITLSQGLLQSRDTPLPFLRNKTLGSNDVQQIYSKEKVSRGENSSSSTCEVHVVTRSGHDVKLVSGLTDSEQALYIEQQLEKYLKIKDTPVRGEIPR